MRMTHDNLHTFREGESECDEYRDNNGTNVQPIQFYCGQTEIHFPAPAYKQFQLSVNLNIFETMKCLITFD